MLIAADMAIVIGSCIAAYWLRFHLLPALRPELTPSETTFRFASHSIPIFVAAPLMLWALMWAKLYKPKRDQSFHREATAILKAVVVGLLAIIAILSLMRNSPMFLSQGYSGLQYGIFAAFMLIMLIVWRFTFRALLRELRSRGWNLRHVAIIGTGRLGQVVYHTLQRNSWTGVKPRFFISHHDQPARERCAGLPILGGLQHLDQILEQEHDTITGVFLALPGRLSAHMPDLLMRLERYALDVRIIPDMNPRYMPMNMAINELDGMPVLSVRESPLNGWGGVVKRIVDFTGAAVALLIFAIPMLIIAILVRATGAGPVIFRQERMSLNNKRFRIFKFRTMNHVDAEQQSLRDAGKGTDAWTKADDPRITTIGKFLRRTSLDELPQLFNVLLGEMSLVGPRPERPELIQQFREDWRGYMLRQNVKAGMTGWAQVNGLRGDTSLRKRLQYDLFYIRNWSLSFDLRILFLTLFRGFAHPSAR